MKGIIKSIKPKDRIILVSALAAMFLLLVFRTDLPLHLDLIIFFTAYVLVSFDVVSSAFKTLFKRFRMSEQFLMTIATLGAFALGDYPEALAVMIFYKIGNLFEEYASGRSRDEITSLIKLKPSFARLVKEDGTEEQVKPRMVKAGQVIRVRAGEAVALDGILLSNNASVNLAALTGESLPAVFKKGDEIPSGGINLLEVIDLKVTSDYRNSSITRLINLIEDAAANKSRPEALISRFAVWYTPVVVFFAVLLAMVPLVVPEAKAADWMERALVFLVISCPCALVLSVPLTFFSGIGVISRIGVMIKGSIFLENLARVKALCFDKTGTVTAGRFRVIEVKVTKDHALSCLCALESQSSHPLAAAVTAYGRENNIKVPAVSDVREIAGFGITGIINGREITACRPEYAKKLGVKIDLKAESKGSEIYIVEDGLLIGLVVLKDDIKQEAAPLFARLRGLGIKTAMITGDRKEAAADIATHLGILECYAQMLPEDKLTVFKKIKEDNGLTGFVGDGINDAPVLAAADVGIAMGQFGSASAVEASDVVVMKDDLRKIGDAIVLSRRTLNLAMQNMILVIGVKLLILILGALGFAGIWLAILGDVGLCILAVLNAMRALTWVKNNVELPAKIPVAENVIS